MIKKNHLFYLFVVILAASVYYFDYYKGEKDQEKKDKDAVLIPFLKEEVSKVELKTAAGEMELDKVDKQWTMKKPVSDLAATDEVDGWTQSLTMEKSTEKIGEGESFDWSTYGLDKPKSTLVVTNNAGKKVQLQISEKKNFEGNPFIKKDEEKLVYVGAPVWSTLMEKTAKDLRDKRLLREPLNELEEVVISTPFGLSTGSSSAMASSSASTSSVKASAGLTKPLKIVFTLQNGQWILKDKPSWKLDQNKVREIINAVQNMRAMDFVLDTEPTPEQLKNYGFSSQSLKVTYYLKGVKSFVFDFVQAKSQTKLPAQSWYAWPYDLKRIVVVDDAAVQKIAKINEADLRDHELPFAFNKEDVKKLNIIAEKKLELNKEGESWKASVPGKVEPKEITDFLDKLRQLRVAEFMDGKTTAPGIDGSAQSEKKRFILADGSGKSVFDLKIGGSFKKKEDKKEVNFVYAKTSLYPDVIVLREEDLNSLSPEGLVKDEKIKK